MYFFYINSNNELESINKINYILDSKSKINKNNMIKVIKENGFTSYDTDVELV